MQLIPKKQLARALAVSMGYDAARMADKSRKVSRIAFMAWRRPYYRW
jgi:hypothetical protein